MSFENLCRVIISFENYSKHCEGSHYKRKWLLSESRGYGTLGIQLKKKKVKLNPNLIGHLCDRAPITRQIDSRRANHNQKFCFRYNQ